MEKLKRLPRILLRLMGAYTKQFLWFMFFVFVQLIGMCIAFVVKQSHDKEFVQRLADLPITEESSLMEITASMMEVAGDIVLQTEVITAILVILILGINLLLFKDKNKLKIGKIKPIDIIPFICIGTACNLIVSFIVNLIPQEVLDNTNYTASTTFEGSLIMLVLAIGICGPLLEEIIFRFFMVNSALKFDIKFAFIMPAFLFGLAHMNIVQSAYAFIIGLMFVYFDLKFNSILPSLVMHISVNTLSVIVSEISSNETLQLCFMGGFTLVTMLISIIIFLNNKDCRERFFKIFLICKIKGDNNTGITENNKTLVTENSVNLGA